MPHPSTQDIDYDADTEVVKPYAIEEPDDERLGNNEPDRPVVSSLPDNLERWHIDLIDSMDDLQCESDRTDSTQRSDQKRGQKRKSGAAASGAFPSSAHQSSASAPSGAKHGDGQYETAGIGRKRSRKRSKRVKEDQNRANDSSPTTSNASETCMSSSSAARSTDASGTEAGATNSDSTADKMDVD